MANKQLHELPDAGQLASDDLILVSSTAAHLARRAPIASLPYQRADGGVARRIGDRLDETVSVRDYGAVGDGATDDLPAFQAALDAHGAVFVPAGTFRLATEIHIRPRRRLTGAGRDATLISAEATRAFTFHRNADTYAVDSGGTPDWNRASLADLSIRMTSGGVRIEGHGFFAARLRFSGGAAGGWCLEMVDANECGLRDLSAGYGGGTETLLANGIRWLGATAGVNYGDSTIEEVSLKLAAAGLYGLKIEHAGSPQSLVNNLILSRIQVNAPQADGTPFPGTVGISLSQVRRCLLEQVDVEVVETAFEEIGTAPGGNSGAVSLVSYLGCHSLNCTTPFRDTNGQPGLGGSAMRRTFLGSTQVFPIKVGTDSGDASVRAGLGDTLLPAGVWIPEPSQGQLGVQLRSPNVGQLLVTGDFPETGTLFDGHPKKAQARQALGIDVTSFNVTRVYRPRGYSAGSESRLAIGNGEDHASGGLHRVEISDPLFLTPRAAEPPQPRNGEVVYCESSAPLPAGSPWIGPGWYTRLAGGWLPGVTPIGRSADKERNNDFSVSPLDFGLIHRVNNSADRTVTISSTYDLGQGPQPLFQPGDPDAVLWLVRQGTGRVLLAAGDAGVVLNLPGGKNAIARQYQLVMVVLRYNSATSKIEVYANVLPDGETTYEEAVHWTTASTDPANPYLVSSAHVGKLIRVSNGADSYVSFATGFVPTGLVAATVRLVKVAAGKVNIVAGSGLTLRAPGGVSPYPLVDTNKIVTVHVTSSLDTNQGNSIYVED